VFGHRVAAALATAAACAWFLGAGAPAALAGKCSATVTPTFKDVPYKTLSNGGVLKFDVFVPAGGGPFPAVVVIDGGSWKSSCKEDVGPDGRHFSQDGYVAFVPNVRKACDGRNKFCGWHAPAPVEDLRDLMTLIRTSPDPRWHVDTANVGAMGVSSGGQLAYMLGETGVAGSTRPDYVAGFSGDADMPFACGPGGNSGVCDDRANYIGCTLNACGSTWAQNNPTALAVRAAAPTFIVSGQNDKRVRIDEARHLNTALSNAGATVSLCEVKSGQHSQDLEPLPCTTGGSASSWDRMIAFFDAHQH
jgi:acetyl esterase/lipase